MTRDLSAASTDDTVVSWSRGSGSRGASRVPAPGLRREPCDRRARGTSVRFPGGSIQHDSLTRRIFALRIGIRLGPQFIRFEHFSKLHPFRSSAATHWHSSTATPQFAGGRRECHGCRTLGTLSLLPLHSDRTVHRTSTCPISHPRRASMPQPPREHDAARGRGADRARGTRSDSQLWHRPSLRPPTANPHLGPCPCADLCDHGSGADAVYTCISHGIVRAPTQPLPNPMGLATRASDDARAIINRTPDARRRADRRRPTTSAQRRRSQGRARVARGATVQVDLYAPATTRARVCPTMWGAAAPVWCTAPSMAVDPHPEEVDH